MVATTKEDDVDLAAEFFQEFLNIFDSKAVERVSNDIKKISKGVSDAVGNVSDKIEMEAIMEFSEEVAMGTKEMWEENVDVGIMKEQATHSYNYFMAHKDDYMRDGKKIVDTQMKYTISAIETYFKKLARNAQKRLLNSGDESRDGNAEAELPIIGVRDDCEPGDDDSTVNDRQADKYDTLNKALSVRPPLFGGKTAKKPPSPEGSSRRPLTVELEEVTKPTDDESKCSIDRSVAESIAESLTEKPLVVVDYEKNKTKLYSLIEKQNWDGVMDRLDTNPEEASVWVCRYRKHNATKILWKMLPIHKVCYPKTTNDADGKMIRCGIRAKICVVEKLLQVYPDGANMVDDVNMTPLHLACRNSASSVVLTCLLDKAPKAMDIKDYKGRTPLQVVESSVTTLNKQRIVSLLKEHKRKQMNFAYWKENQDEVQV